MGNNKMMVSASSKSEGNASQALRGVFAGRVTLLAATALLAVSGLAQADVTLYGIADMSAVSVSNAAGNGASAGTTGGNVTSMADGIWMPSLLGIKGSEDLGNGMKANFKLEGDLSLTNGQMGQSIYFPKGMNNGSPMFDRWAIVGLSGAFGEVNAGQQLDPLFVQSFLNGARVAHSGSLALNGQLAYGSGVNNNSMVGVFTNDMITWKSTKFYDTTVQLGYVFGGAAGTMGPNSGFNALINYSANGLNLNAGYEVMHQSNSGTSNFTSLPNGAPSYGAPSPVGLTNPSAETLTKGLVGAKYNWNDWLFAAQVNTFKTSGVPNCTAGAGVVETSILNPATCVDSTGYEVGLGYNFTPKLQGVVNYVSMKDNVSNVTPTVSSISLKYTMSKSTSVWVLADRSDGKGVGGWNALYNDGAANVAAVGNAVQNALALGMTHSF